MLYDTLIIFLLQGMLTQSMKMQADFLMFVFGARARFQALRKELSNCLQGHLPDNQQIIEEILDLAVSLTDLTKHIPQNKEITSYLARMQHQSSNSQLSSIQQFSSAVFRQRISLILKEAYGELKIDELLFLRMQLSARDQLQCKMTLCRKYPDNEDLLLSYIESALKLKSYNEGVAYVKERVQYFERAGQRPQSDRLKTLYYALLMFGFEKYEAFYLLNKPFITQEQVIKTLILTSFELQNKNLFSFLLKKYNQSKLDSNEMLSLSFFELTRAKCLPCPIQYRAALDNLTEQTQFYNLAMSMRFQHELFYEKSEHYLNKQIASNSGWHYVHYQAAQLALKMQRIQLYFHHMRRYRGCIWNTVDDDLMLAFCYAMRKDHKKAVQVARKIKVNVQTGLRMMIIYYKAGLNTKAKAWGGTLSNRIMPNQYDQIGVIILQLLHSRAAYIFEMQRLVFNSQYCRPTYLLFRKQFSIFCFLTQYCYASHPAYFRFGKYFASKAWEVIECLKAYSPEGAARMRSILEERKPIDIYYELFI